ncbi:hypothetical protein [Ornithinibacillus halotolerans]|uniref:Uncharacterized protein n=1 Tax=Ornithinibacillus halotolerans TaxID=1274357 RepID=A0A916S472_9BACI|nr:hypothetical protein [Ornithinibacillus halotolerans]GGA83305.1 hypothetical protein GCM10008025_28080 [Ornithinibacillus halotolerans]
MSLFINKKLHPTVFKNNASIKEPNQSYYETNYLKELIENQNKLNDSFHQSMKNFKISLQKHRHNDENRWQEVKHDIEVIKQSEQKHQEFEKEMRGWIKLLKQNNQELHRIVQSNSEVNEEILQEINRIHESNQLMMQQVEEFFSMNQQVNSKVETLVNGQETLLEQAVHTNEKQDKVINHLEKQDAILEKNNRELNHIRSIIFERTSFIAEKIEESVKLTSSVLYKFFTKSDKPIGLLIGNEKKEKKGG